ncbi:hypothetical protein [Spirosoma telluris]|uniref:hypothetical protein n=1 Tax=Spirosoma telluris TaxID=2183553 RepID=UPI001314A80D
MIVKAYNASGVASASATTNAGGSYTLTVGSSSQFRIEFTSLLTGDYESFRGTGSATSVQFVNGGTSNVNLGVNYPVDYCQLDPLVIVPCYVNGNSTGTGSGTAVAANRDVLISLPYSSTGDSPTENPIALNSQLGTVYGVAYQREAKYIFTSAFLKRHSGLGPGGAGAIYLTKSSGTTYTHSVFATLPTAITAVTAAGSTTVASNTTRGLSTSAASANYDPLIFDQVGKAGLGDMELSDDGTELFVVNLGDRKLYRIPIVNPTSATPTPGTITSYTIPTPTQTSGSQFRPFGLKYYRDRVYVGGVTTNEAVSTTVSFGVGSTSNTPLITRDTTGMKAVVYEFNPANGSFTTVLTFPLTYKKGASDNDQTGSSRADRWFPWVSVQPSYPNPTAGQLPNRYARNDLANASHPQPWLTDIEIDVDGSMIIALRDRFGEQYGNQNYGTDAPSTQLYRAIAPGDILRAGKCSPNVNQWTIESNAKLCNGVATLGAGTNQGIGGENIIMPML